MTKRRVEVKNVPITFLLLLLLLSSSVSSCKALKGIKKIMHIIIVMGEVEETCRLNSGGLWEM